MTEEEIHIEQLMMEKLANVIGEADEAFLDNLIRTDVKIRLQWEKIESSFDKNKLNVYLEYIDEEQGWGFVKENIIRKKRIRKMRIRRYAVAASILLPLIFAGLFFFRSDPSEEIALVDDANSSVRLYVGGTQEINLSQYNQSPALPTLKNINLNVGNGNLSYTALNKQVSHQVNTLVVPATKNYRLVLSDGTEVTLNAMSELKFAFVFSGDKREVWLDGEAYFNVAGDEDHPFIVHTPLTAIKVLGTAFNVNTYDSLHLKTSLVEGAVITEAKNGETVKLKPGYEAVFSPHEGFTIAAFDKNNVLSWMQGIYYFQNAPLENIRPVIRRWYGDSIVFDNAEASSNRFTGALLKNKPLKEFLENIALTSNIRYYEKDSKIHISMVN